MLCRTTQTARTGALARESPTCRPSAHRAPAAPRTSLIVPHVQPAHESGTQAPHQETRRTLLTKGLAVAGAVIAPSWSSIAPAARATVSESEAGDIANRIAIDFAKNQYYVTGDITEDLYDSDCKFVDPTTTVTGPQKYANALKVLFDPKNSKAELISLKIDSPTRIILRWRLEGTLNLGGLSIKPYTGTTTYVVDENTGKIKEHLETWDISTLDAFISPFFPSFGAPPAPPAEKLRADLIRNSFLAAGQQPPI